MNFSEALQRKIDLKTKPLGALGKLEKIAYRIGKIQNTLEPKLKNPHIVLFAGDHGIAQSGVSAYPSDVTYQMVTNIINGGAAISVFCKQNEIQTVTVDSGVNHNFENITGLINAKINFGTKNFLNQKAMSETELETCFQKSKEIIDGIAEKGCNIIGFGEMGIGNTSAASMIMHHITKIPLEDCIGRGTGLNDSQLQKKFEILSQANIFHGKIEDPKTILQTYGGFEIAQICGAMLVAYQHNMIILIDGFIATSALLIAQSLEPEIINNTIFCHNSNEVGHQKMLNYLEADPILHFDMRVGEGTGCALAYPLIKSAVVFLNEMASFESAGVSNKE